jgi:hypothetical protein
MRYLAPVALVAIVTGCSDSALGVDNTNNPDRARVLGNANDVESLAASQFQQVFSATFNDLYSIDQSMGTMSLMNFNGLANNGMGPRGGIPRQPLDNSNGNAYMADNYRDFRILTAVARTSADILRVAKEAGFALPGGAGDLNRLLGFAHFTYGVSLGYLSMAYDSAGIPRPSDTTETPAVEGYQAVNAWALAQLDSAQAYFGKSPISNVPTGWANGVGGPAITAPDFVRLIRSYRAKIRAGVARTPAERTAVAWPQVVADATAGITSDFIIFYAPSSGWDHVWLNQAYHFRSSDTNWHLLTPYIIGMADVSGGFESWLAQPRDSRAPFLIVTPDLRFPQGTTRTAQMADRGGQGVTTGGRYIRNHDPGLDQSGTGWGLSYYTHYRFYEWNLNNRIGPKPYLTKAENDMLAAEAYIRTGNIAAAAALIDLTRVKNGLPALTGVVTTSSQAIPGGSQCVPRIPVGPTFTTTACGTILEAMKWEKRMESAYAMWGAWYFDARGWGDLPEGTPLNWPTPIQELNARRLPTYNVGGVGRSGGAGASTYGYGAGTR